jgi:hypothetical protein
MSKGSSPRPFIPNLGVKGLQFVKEAMVLHGLKFKGQE